MPNSTASISIDEKGNTIISGSRRPDGTMRAPVKIRAGYTPPDEVEKYVSRGKQISNARELYGVPGLGKTSEQQKQPLTKSQKKNLQRKAAKERKSAEPSTPSSNGSTTIEEQVQQSMAAVSLQDDGSNIDTSKEIKKLNKKIRQAQDLIAKQQAGEELNEEQKSKIDKVAEWQRQAKQLESQL